jgi:hypothetical protein
MEFWKASDRLVVEIRSAITSAIRVPEKRARHFACICSVLLRAGNLSRMRPLLRLLAKTAARRCSMVFYYALPSSSGKTRLKSRLSVSCHFPGQIDAGSWLSIRVVHNG